MEEKSIKRLLQDRYLGNIKLAIFGLIAAMALHFTMLLRLAEVPNLSFWIIVLGIEFGIAIQALIFEKLVQHYMVRQILIDFMVILIMGTCGFNFSSTIEYVTDPELRLTMFSLIMGVTAATAFTFSANRYIFPLAAIVWMGPTWFYIVFYEPSIPMYILAAMAVIYVAVLSFLSYQDYEHQYKLIETQHRLEDEKALVVESSRKLEKILSEVRQLKTQQDGDYYLTSLLLQPLGVTLADHPSVEIKSILEQKKQFQFRHHKKAIGGDINIAHNLTLRGRECIIFLNADAMGKSMQGAGGALVLGAVFQSIVERARYSSTYRTMYPERWLKNAFIDLHTVFESFEGSMLVSVVISILDVNNGFLYYINAEHPYPILLRDKKAEFLSDEFYYRKLGTTGLDGRIHISTFQLHPNDILILGSDGRDDIAFGESDSGQRIINEDETRILTLTEQSKGDLQELCKLIKAEGELTDDLSLMGVRYLGPPAMEKSIDDEKKLAKALELLKKEEIQEALILINQIDYKKIRTAGRLKRVIQQLIIRGKNRKASELVEPYAHLSPGDYKALFAGSVCAFRVGELERAINLGERVRMRFPDYKENLEHLAQVYMKSGNEERAKLILESVGST